MFSAQVLLHVLHSFIPKECVAETDLLKPLLDKKGSGLDKIMEKVEMTDAEWQRELGKRRQFSEKELRKISPDAILDYAMEIDDSQESQQQLERHYRTRPVDAGEILVAPVSVTYTVSDKQQSEVHDDAASGDEDDDNDGVGNSSKKKMAMFWIVILRTRKCYNFNEHIQCMINELDKEDKSRLVNAASREYEARKPLLPRVLSFCVCVCVTQRACPPGAGRDEHDARSLFVSVQE